MLRHVNSRINSRISVEILTQKQKYFSISEAATILEKNEDTIRRWCRSGKLPAIPHRFGSRITFQIPYMAIEEYLCSQEKEQKEQKEDTTKKQHKEKRHVDLLPYFKKYCLKGMLNGKAFSERTINDYIYWLKKYFLEYSKVNVSNIKQYFIYDESLDSHKEKKVKIYKALVCFCKFLIQEGIIEQSELVALQPLKPEGNRNPERHTVSENEFYALQEACHSITEIFLILLFGCTGIRASEASEIRIKDIDLDKRELLIHGKGGINRIVAILPTLYSYLLLYLEYRSNRSNMDYMLISESGGQMSRHNIYKRLRQIGKRINVICHPHALRSAFVTINANKGRPIVILSRIVGHKKVRTTELYLRTTQKEALEAMHTWD